MEKIYIERSGMDRRQQNIPVQYDRRCDIDRRVDPEGWFEAQKQKAIIQRSNIDRRQVNIPVQADRRCGIDRRLNLQDWEDYQKYKELQEKKVNFEKNLAGGTLSIIPFGRRIEGIKEAFNNHETFKGMGKAIIQLVNIRPDSQDVKSAAVQVFNKDFKLYERQNPFSFIHGTSLDKISALQKLGDYDKTLYQTKFGERICNKLGAGIPEFTEDGLKLTGSLRSKIIGRALLRIPVLSLLFLGLLELPTIIKSENHSNKAMKSCINIVSIVSMGALAGAIGAYFGPIGSLVGLGIGSYIGNKLGYKANKLLFVSNS